MKLKLNSAYQSGPITIIPRSHFGNRKGEKFAIVQKIELNETRYISQHTTFTAQDFRKFFGLPKNEGVEIL